MAKRRIKFLTTLALIKRFSQSKYSYLALQSLDRRFLLPQKKFFNSR